MDLLQSKETEYDLLKKNYDMEVNELKLSIENLVELQENDKRVSQVQEEYEEKIKKSLEIEKEQYANEIQSLSQKLSTTIEELQQAREMIQEYESIKTEKTQLENQISELQNSLEEIEIQKTQSLQKTEQELIEALKFVQNLNLDLDSSNQMNQQLQNEITKYQERIERESQSMDQQLKSLNRIFFSFFLSFPYSFMKIEFPSFILDTIEENCYNFNNTKDKLESLISEKDLEIRQKTIELDSLNQGNDYPLLIFI